MHHKRKSRSKRPRLYRKKLCPWYWPLVAKGKQVAERRADRTEREQRSDDLVDDLGPK
jgi:hypothetical protein